MAKYYVLTGETISADESHALGIVARITAPAEVETELKTLIAAGKFDKFRKRELPEKFRVIAGACTKENIENILAGRPPADVPEALAARIMKSIKRKAPLALRFVNEIIDQQACLSVADAVALELGRLQEIFSTADALEGLSSFGRRRPEYKGK